MIIKKCKICGFKFQALNRRDYKVCSKECRSKLRTENLKKEWQTSRKNQRTSNYPGQMKILKERMKGEKNPSWKSDNKVTKSTIHSWARTRIKKPKVCPKCKINKAYDLANLNKHEYRRKLSDYQWMCRKCHMDMDGRKPPLQSKKNKTL